MNVAILGTGRVGLATGAALASLGHRVGAVDIDERKIGLLATGSVPFHEPGLEEMVRQGIASGRLTFTSDPRGAVAPAAVAFLCVGTPPSPGGEADLSAIEAVTGQVARSAAGALVVVVKSTVPVGTAEKVRAGLSEARPDLAFAVVSNPEFLREGKAVEDSLRPVRILVGGDDPRGIEALKEIYAPLLAEGVPWVATDHRTAELAKYACNAFLATKISYMNAVARVCELAGADVTLVARTMGMDPRIGPSYLAAGLGYGGYCLPKDIQAFERSAAELGYEFGLLREVDRLNREAVEAAYDRVRAAVGEVRGARVALLGLAFKPGTDNVTGAQALALARRLLESGADVVGFDPQAGGNAKEQMPDLEVAGDPYLALEGARCAVLCTEWPELVSLDPRRVREAMASPVVVDARNALDAEALASAGITHVPTGRPFPA